LGHQRPSDSKATTWPSALTAAATENSSPAVPWLLTLIRWVVPGGWARAADGPSRATTSAARADNTTRRHGRASQGRAAGAGSGRDPIGNGGGHGDLLEDGEAAPQTTAEHTTDPR
jgi:hypothetical protein